MKLSLVQYDEEFLKLSWEWLIDTEIKELTMTPSFSKEDQEKFFASIGDRDDYKIWGLLLDGTRKIGACGLKNICENSAEYWGYIGEKDLWGKGLGKQMMALVHAKVGEIGLKSLCLIVSKSNNRAISLYRKIGYEVESEDDLTFIMRTSTTN